MSSLRTPFDSFREGKPDLVVFDFGNVIARFNNLHFVRKLLEGSSLNPIFMQQKIFSESTLSQEFETGALSFADFKRGVENTIGRRYSDEFFQKAYCDIFEFIPETIDLIAFLHGKVKLGMLSNTNILHFEQVIRHIPVYDCFDQYSFSFQVGAMKPDPAIYEDVLKKWNGPAEKVFYLDDIDGYVEAARTMGMRGMTYYNPEEVSHFVRRFFSSPATSE